jgi:hypothetical protein
MGKCTAATAATGATADVVGITRGRVTRIGNLPKEKHTMLDIKVVTWSLGIFGAVTFVVCVLYGLIAPESLHMSRGLEVALPGFRWLTVFGFLLGLVESFLYGVYAGLVFVPIYNAVWKRTRRS